MGLANDTIALYTSWLLLPWSLKPLWSPLLEMYQDEEILRRTPGVGGRTLPGDDRAGAPATELFPLQHRAVRGRGILLFHARHCRRRPVYGEPLARKKQAAYAGWQGGFYNVARFFSQGGLVILAGVLEAHMDVPHAWMTIFVRHGADADRLGLVSRTHAAGDRAGRSAAASATFADVVVSFLQEAADLSAARCSSCSTARGRSGGADRAPVPGGPPIGRRAGPHHGPVRDHLRHVRHGCFHRRQRPGRILHLLAGTAPGARAADLRHEPAEPGLRLPERGPARQVCGW